MAAAERTLESLSNKLLDLDGIIAERVRNMNHVTVDVYIFILSQKAGSSHKTRATGSKYVIPLFALSRRNIRTTMLFWVIKDKKTKEKAHNVLYRTISG